MGVDDTTSDSRLGVGERPGPVKDLRGDPSVSPLLRRPDSPPVSFKAKERTPVRRKTYCKFPWCVGVTTE